MQKIKSFLLQVNVRDPKISGMVCYHKNGLERSRVTLMSSLSTLGKVSCCFSKCSICIGREITAAQPTMSGQNEHAVVRPNFRITGHFGPPLFKV